MTINPIQPNTDTKYLSYRDQKGSLKTKENIKPLPPQGHLVNDTLLSVPKFWIKDIQYDLKALKDGFQGNTNDHQQGRLNDVGLKLGGIGIAAYLASKTTDPKLRLMEYLGLGSFLAAMSLYPKIAINAPSRIVHGFDIGKEYIDDQGRKKSVFQDSNYIPFDMYKGDYPGEDLDIIGDRMGIPRDIKNRHDLIKEQMRKIATQNNTLWMLTAGFATPVMAALMCVGLEKLIVPVMEKIRNAKTNNQIASILKASQDMTDLKSNSLSSQVESILKKFEGKELPQEDFNKIVSILSDKTDSKISNGIKEDLSKLLKSEVKFKTDSDSIISVIKDNIPSVNRTNLEKVFLPTTEELDEIINKLASGSKEISEGQIGTLKEDLRKLFESKITSGNKEFYEDYATEIINKIASSIKEKPSHTINETQISKAVDFAKIIGDFKTKEKLVDKYLSTKFEEAPQTMLARAYEKFENALFDVLDIRFKDMKKIKESPALAEEILRSKLETLSKDQAKYEKAIKKLSGIMVECDTMLHGKGDKSKILDLIHATENVYNNTATRLNNLDGKFFSRTINQLVKQDMTTPLEHSISTKEELIKFLDGTLEAKKGIADWSLEYAKEHSKGVGSAKRDAISRIVDRYQGVKNSFNRILLTMDVFNRKLPEGKYESEVAKMGKDFVLTANSSQFTQKFKLTNNPELYRDIMYSIFGKDNLTESTVNGMKDVKNGNILTRFKDFIQRTLHVMGNNDIDFTKPNHKVGIGDLAETYRQSALTRRSKFDLVAQDPVNMIKGGAGRKYGSLYWLRKASIIGASVLAVAVIAQFFFGKIKNPQNVQKQVNND